MHIVVFAEDFYPNTSGGAHTRWRFCEIAVKKGHEITVFTPRIEGSPSEEIVSGVHIKRPFPAKPESLPAYSPISVVTRILFSILLLPYVLLWFRGKDIDGIHSVSHSMHWVAKALSEVYNKPVVTFIGYTPSLRGAWKFSPKFFLERINFRFFLGDVTLCRTPKTKELVDRYSKARIVHGILNEDEIFKAISELDLEKVRADLGLDDDTILLLFVGRLVPIKNPKGALNLISDLPKNFSLVMVGDGPEMINVEGEVERRKLGNRVQLLGKLPHRKTLGLIVASDGLVLTSHEEAYPTVIFEALAFDKPVFAPPLGILPEISHKKLFIVDRGALGARIQDYFEYNYQNSRNDVDKQTINRFSTERYTETILESFL